MQCMSISCDLLWPQIYLLHDRKGHERAEHIKAAIQNKLKDFLGLCAEGGGMRWHFKKVASIVSAHTFFLLKGTCSSAERLSSLIRFEFAAITNWNA